MVLQSYCLSLLSVLSLALTWILIQLLIFGCCLLLIFFWRVLIVLGVSLRLIFVLFWIRYYNDLFVLLISKNVLLVISVIIFWLDLFFFFNVFLIIIFLDIFFCVIHFLCWIFSFNIDSSLFSIFTRHCLRSHPVSVRTITRICSLADIVFEVSTGQDHISKSLGPVLHWKKAANYFFFAVFVNANFAVAFLVKT